MALKNSVTGEVRRPYTITDLEDAARLMRGYDLVALNAAGSGHAGGTLSIMDITAALYLRVANHDPQDPDWADRDHIIWSPGHKETSLSLGLACAGFCALDDVVLLRKLGSPFQGHPHWLKLEGVEVSTGSLGQGLSIAVGIALAGKLNSKSYTTFCIMGDGEQQEGQVWEAAMAASHHGLENLVAIVDCNRLQIDGPVAEVMNVEPLEEKYRSFGWDVRRIDGHNMKQVVEALESAKEQRGKPLVVLADTVKGKGVSFMENVAGWHGKTPNSEELKKGLDELGVAHRIPVEALLEKARNYQAAIDRRLHDKMPEFNHDYWWNRALNMKVKMEPTRKGFGQALAALGDDERIVCLGLDISGSITISDFYASKPERKNRWLSMGIAEHSPPRSRPAWRARANCRSSEPMRRSRPLAILTRSAPPSATANSTYSSRALTVVFRWDPMAQPIRRLRICSPCAAYPTCQWLCPATPSKHAKPPVIFCSSTRDRSTFVLPGKRLRWSPTTGLPSCSEKRT
jgi:transketolase